MFEALYLGFCVLVGLFAIGRDGGFFLYFLLSLLFTPVAGLVLLLIVTPNVVDTEGRPVKLKRK
jgi:hypothetical protein